MPGSPNTSLAEGEFRYRITVALFFRRSDARALWQLAAHHWPKDAYGDVSMFGKAAKAAEDGTALVLQCMDTDELQEIAGFFPRFGIAPPRIEEVRLGG